MKSGDIRSFFMANANKTKPPQPQQNSQPNPSQDSSKKSAHKDDSSKSDSDKKRKSDVMDQGTPHEPEHKKRLKKMKDIDDLEDDDRKVELNISGKSGKKPGESASKGHVETQPKQTYTSDDLDKFKFGDKTKRKTDENKPGQNPRPASGTGGSVSKSMTPAKESHTSVKKDTPPGHKGGPTSTGSAKKSTPSAKEMEMESEGDSDRTEVLSDHDSYEEKKKAAPPMKSVTSVKDDKPKSLKDIANQYKKARPSMHTFHGIDEEDDEEEVKGKGKGKGEKGKGSTKKKPVGETIQGPFSGQTIVMTGVMGTMTRDNLTDLLKMLGAKVTGSVSTRTSMLIVGSVLEDGRPVETSKKYKTAAEKGTKILTESEFDDLLMKKTGKSLSDGLDAFASGASAPKSSGTSTAQAGGSNKKAAPASAAANKMVTPKKKTGGKQNELWTQKYAPSDVSEIIGNQNFIKEIMTWLQDWEVVVLFGQKKEVKFNARAGKDNWGQSNVNARACLISGPPGIGKTTAVRLIAKKMGYDIIEQNASDVRNKKAVEGLLKDLVDNKLVSYKQQDHNPNKKFLILMDEVDGMSAGDRGGNQALIAAIKNTKTPILCICNDRQHPKIRTLANYCYDVKFHKPQKQSVAKRLVEICNNEGLKVDMNSLEYLCENFNNDIRQLLNYLQMYSRRSDTLTYNDARSGMSQTRKDDAVMINNFEAARLLMTGRNKSIREKLDLFFIDYDLIPLMVQENYLPGNPNPSKDDLEKIAKATDLVATGDILNRKIRQYGDWGLMPNFAFVSSIYPCELLNPMVSFPKFPEWLGKNSSSRKKQREIRELRSMMSPVITGTRLGVLFDYTPAMIHLIHYNLKNEGSDDVDTVVEILDHYHLELEVAKEHLPDLQLNTSSLKDPFSGISPQTKSLLTRTFNSRHKSSIKGKATKKKAVGGGGEEGGMGHRFNPEAEEEEDKEQELGDDLEDENAEGEDDTVVQLEEKKVKPAAKSKAQSSKKQTTGEKKKTTKK